MARGPWGARRAPQAERMILRGPGSPGSIPLWSCGPRSEAPSATSTPTAQATAPSRGAPPGRLPRSASVDFIRLQRGTGGRRSASRCASREHASAGERRTGRDSGLTAVSADLATQLVCVVATRRARSRGVAFEEFSPAARVTLRASSVRLDRQPRRRSERGGHRGHLEWCRCGTSSSLNCGQRHADRASPAKKRDCWTRRSRSIDLFPEIYHIDLPRLRDDACQTPAQGQPRSAARCGAGNAREVLVRRYGRRSLEPLSSFKLRAGCSPAGRGALTPLRPRPSWASAGRHRHRSPPPVPALTASATIWPLRCEFSSEHSCRQGQQYK